MVKQVFVYRIKKVSNFAKDSPLRKILHPKVKYIDTDGNKFTSIEAAKRLYKFKQEYKRRVNKPQIRILVQ